MYQEITCAALKSHPGDSWGRDGICKIRLYLIYDTFVSCEQKREKSRLSEGQDTNLLASLTGRTIMLRAVNSELGSQEDCSVFEVPEPSPDRRPPIVASFETYAGSFHEKHANQLGRGLDDCAQALW